MANEISVSASLGLSKGNVVNRILALASGVTFTQTGIRYAEGAQSVPTTAGGTILPLGPLAGATLGWCLLKNNDATNFVEILTTTSGTTILKLKPGEIALFRFGSGVVAPAALANTATCQLEFLILED